MAGLASEADWVFIPEWPPQKGWEDILCKKLSAVSKFICVCSWDVRKPNFGSVSVLKKPEPKPKGQTRNFGFRGFSQN